MTLGLFKRLANWGFGRNKQEPKVVATIRKCRFEAMEPRQMLDADPVVAGITYLENDTGEDNTPDYFEVTFEGGSDTTQMTQFVINGDQDGDGVRSDGDMFFDVVQGGPGTGGFHQFQFHAGGSQGIDANDVDFSVSDDGLSLIVTLENFEAGDILAFTIDVDEVERFKTDKIASGVEFEGTQFQASFEDEHFTFTPRDVAINATLTEGFVQEQTEGIFYDEYDQLLSAGELLAGDKLELTRDGENSQSDRNAAAIDVYDLVAKPVTISGTVYEDSDQDCHQTGLEHGIEGVTIRLERFNENTGQFEFVADTTTDQLGNYEFGLDLNLQPGKFRVTEVQPDGFLSVGKSAGFINGNQVLQLPGGDANVFAEINLIHGGYQATEYNFCEVRPVSLSGHVWHDENNDGVMGNNEERLANVLIRIDRTGGISSGQADPFAGTDPIFVRTNGNGFYEATGLPPGTYQITEINNYPNETSPLDGFIDGKDSLGNVPGGQDGTKSNDRFNGIVLTSGQEGVQYNFGEIKPVSISGHVHITTPEGDCVEPGSPEYRGIEGVTIQLLDDQGNFVADTKTNALGQYQFSALPPGNYSIVEVQPEGYIDAGDHVGSHGGTLAGNDRITNISLNSGQNAVNYDFCEREPAAIKGMVWYDRNNNGIQDNGEQGISGVRIDLLNESGNPAEIFDINGNPVPAFVFTDSDGRYGFENLTAGTYSIRETQPGTFVDGQDIIGTLGGNVSNDQFTSVSIKDGQIGEDYNFGEFRLASIEGFVFGDVNGNCIHEPGEGDRPLANVIINLFDGDGNLVETTTTNAEGRYIFEGLLPGEYAVAEITPDGFINGDAHAGKVNGVTVGELSLDRISKIFLSSEDKGTDFDFCEHIPTEISGKVYHDINNNGVRNENGEHGISNVTIQLLDQSGNLVRTTVTNPQGEYSFTNLKAGTYTIVEIQPEAYHDGIDLLGDVGGQSRGAQENDRFVNVELKGGDKGVHYDFGEFQLGRISGFVHTDNDGDCVLDANEGEIPIEGVRMELIDQNGTVVGVATTNAQGFYEFDKLPPGVYSVRQSQPENYFDIGQRVGFFDSWPSGSLQTIPNSALLELQDAGISFEPGDDIALLANNPDAVQILSTYIAPLKATGDASGENIITGIEINSGYRLVSYNFCEEESAAIHGKVFQDGPAFVNEDGSVPDNYRDQRDGIYTAGVDQGLAGVEMSLWYYIDPDTEEFIARPVTVADVLPGHYPQLEGLDPSTPITVTTDANGNYSFTGLRAGNYIVFEAQPEGYTDSNDTVGTTTGFAVNSETIAHNLTGPLQPFSVSQIMDSLANIQVNAGQQSFQNNFSEVIAEPDPNTPEPPVDPPPYNPPGGGTPNRPGYVGPGLLGAQPLPNINILGGVRTYGLAGPVQNTWHLSVINAGAPRGEQSVIAEGNALWLNASFISSQDWMRFQMDQVSWSFTSDADDDDDYLVDENQTVFGNLDGIPVAGDFNGDGVDEIAVFNEGYWMIDINGNGRWDREDFVANLGSYDDRPVVGDWDGDGKDDIGIYGPQWDGDVEAIAREPGLPDFANRPETRPKNVPPLEPDATDGARLMRLTSHGKSRADLIDHVFGYGDAEDKPVVGDWNGDGIRTIGLFSNGQWRIDLNGDGRLNESDAQFQFGQTGDQPVVGDFDGNGVEEVGVYRQGKWIIDINGNQEMDAHDKVFEMGGASDTPVVGDWNGDGSDEPALYHSNKNAELDSGEVN